VLLIPEAIVLLIGCCFMTALLYTLIKVRPTTPIITSLRPTRAKPPPLPPLFSLQSFI
jgi:hypothetical protein